MKERTPRSRLASGLVPGFGADSRVNAGEVPVGHRAPTTDHVAAREERADGGVTPSLAIVGLEVGALLNWCLASAWSKVREPGVLLGRACDSESCRSIRRQTPRDVRVTTSPDVAKPQVDGGRSGRALGRNRTCDPRFRKPLRNLRRRERLRDRRNPFPRGPSFAMASKR